MVDRMIVDAIFPEPPLGQRARGGSAMSSRVIIDSDELERFARELSAFNHGLQDGMHRLRGESSRLAQTWRDPAHEQFDQELAQTMASLDRFLHISEQYVPYLMSKAQRARDVHR